MVSRDRVPSWNGLGVHAHLGGTVDVQRVDPRNVDVLYAGDAELGSADGLLKSVDGGFSWHTGSGPGGAPGPTHVLSFAFDPREPDVQDGGPLDHRLWERN